MGKVKWDAVADQTLFTKLLECHDISIDFAKIAEAWPGEDNEAKPTPRAIRERIFKIKSNAASASGASGVSGTATAGSSPVTPKKRVPRKKNTDATTTGSPARKRKRVTKTVAAKNNQAKEAGEAELPMEDSQSLVNPSSKPEVGLELIDPRLHAGAEEQLVLLDDDKKDADWSPEKDESSLEDSNSEHVDHLSQY